MDVEVLLSRAREAQRGWSSRPLRQRILPLQRVRQLIVERTDALIRSVTFPSRRSVAETLSAEVLPLADACRFLQRRAERLLATRIVSRRGRPAWLSDVRVHTRREPHGVVLILGPANYPLLLPGVQTLQALVAGNAVLLKPGRGGMSAAQQLTGLIRDARVDEDLVQILPEDPTIAQQAICTGVDKVFLTGSAETGRRVLAQLAPALTPATMELSGCDAVFVCDDADVGLAADRDLFWLRLRQWHKTCIAPRRVFVPGMLAQPLQEQMLQRVQRLPAMVVGPPAIEQLQAVLERAGQRGVCHLAGGICSPNEVRPIVLAQGPGSGPLVVQEDLFAPLVVLRTVRDQQEALALDRLCPYALGAAVFGRPRTARALADQIDAGCVVINDLIAPTADPRVPFAARRSSGFGVTRGAEGLQEMTTLKAVVERRGRWRPHYQEIGPAEQEMLADLLPAWAHGGGFGSRWRALRRLLHVLRAAREPHAEPMKEATDE